MKVSRYIIAAILLMIFGCGSGGGGGSSSGTTSAPPSTPISSAPVFAYTAVPSGSFYDEGKFNSIAHTQDHGAVLVSYRAIEESINMISSPNGDGVFKVESYYFRDFDVEADNITLLENMNNLLADKDKKGYHILYLHKTDGLLYAFNNDLGKNDGFPTEWIPERVTDEILYDNPDGTENIFTGQSANNTPMSGSQIRVTFTIGGVEYSEVDDGAGRFNNTHAKITSSSINYQTGQINITFTTAPDNNTDITISTREILYDTPDGAVTAFTGQSADNTPLSAGQITVTYTIGGVTYSDVDDGYGAFNDSNGKITSSTIDYQTGDIYIAFGEILYDAPDGVITSFTGQSADNTPLLAGHITVTYIIGGVTYSEVDDGAGKFNNTHAKITSSSIDYQTGQINITFTTAPDDDTNITISTREILYDTPDGAITAFTGQSADNTPLSAGQIIVTYTIGGITYSDVDDGDGAFNDSNEKIALSTIDYQTGLIDIIFNTAPDDNTDVTISSPPTAPDDNTDITIDYDGVPCSIGDDPGRYSSIVLDGDEVHISYYDYHASILNGNLKFASRDTNGNWTSRSIDTTGDVGRYSYLATYNGSFYISYYDSDNLIIKLISNETGAPNGWNLPITLAASVVSATPCPMVIDNSGTKHILFFQDCGGNGSGIYGTDLCYRTIGAFATVPVDTSGIGNGLQASFVLDASGKAHISYYDSKDKDLKYAYQTAP